MKAVHTPIAGSVIVTFDRYSDMRGHFEVAYHEEEFRQLGLPTYWAQDSFSESSGGVVRGLHMQTKNPQGKLVRCLSGAIWDVCVDVRPKSPTFKQMVSVVLSEDEPTALYCPPGTLHGFAALSHRATVSYKCSTLYDRDSDAGVIYSDPELSINWPVTQPKLSHRDVSLPSLAEFLRSLGYDRGNDDNQQRTEL